MEKPDLDRYARQIVMEQIGIKGQLRLKNAKVTVAGIGGLGSLVALQLVGMGVGRVNLIDRDIVTETDLHRQYLYTEEDVGRLKVIAAKERLEKLNSDVEIRVSDSTIDESSVSSLVSDSDVVIDCLDSVNGKYSINRACIQQRKPYVYGSAVSSYGVVTSIIPGQTPCLKCIYPELDEETALTCAVAGVHPSILGIVASIQVSEAVRLITGRGFALASKLIFIDLDQLSFETVNVRRNEKCSECGIGSKTKEKLQPHIVERSCTRDGLGTYFLNPRHKIELKFDDEYFRRTGLHKAFEDQALTILLKKDGSGIALVRERVYDVELFERELLARYGNLVRELEARQEED
ncbi:MAG: HesA/MoeB/ThiF family protein [Conexivisphaerales archaeon]